MRSELERIVSSPTSSSDRRSWLGHETVHGYRDWRRGDPKRLGGRVERASAVFLDLAAFVQKPHQSTGGKASTWRRLSDLSAESSM